MRLVLATTLLVCAFPLAAQHRHHHETEFFQASALLPWCEAEARAHFVGMGITPYQWTGRYYDDGNMLVVEGRLRANGEDVPVACRVARGARERYAVVEIRTP